MNKLLLVAVAGMFVLASCKKDRTCECTIDGKAETGSKYTYVKVTKKFMIENDQCVSYNRTATDGTVEKHVCEIK
jgi:hypothetical protein